MISPLGTLLTRVDDALSSAVVSLVGLISQQVPGPMGAAILLLFLISGVRVYKGDGEPLDGLVPWLAGFGIAFWLITNPTMYLYIARDIVITGFPAALIGAATGTNQALMQPAGVGSVLDGLWAQNFQVIALVGQSATFDPMGIVVTGVSLLLCWFNLAALALVAFVYFVCRFFQDLVIIIGPVMLGCWPFPAFRHYFWSWKGVGVSLMLAQVLAFITMQFALLACQPLMAQLTNALLLQVAHPGAGLDGFGTLVAMGFICWSAAAAASAVPIVTFFIGRGGAAPAPIILQPVRS